MRALLRGLFICGVNSDKRDAHEMHIHSRQENNGLKTEGGGLWKTKEAEFMVRQPIDRIFFASRGLDLNLESETKKI